MNYHFLRAILFTLLSASAFAQNPLSVDYDEEAPPPGQTGGHRSVPTFVNVHEHPRTGFSCADKQPGQYYADTENKCAVYYVCIPNERGSMSPQSFACPNGTLFSQSSRVCREHDQVYCPISQRYYESINGNIDSKGQEELYNKPSPLQPWRKPQTSQPSRPRPQAQPQPQSPPPSQPQPSRTQPQPRPQPQPQPQPQPRPQPQPARPLPISIGAPPNSRRSQFTPSATTTAAPPPPPPPASAPVEYEYEYVDYPLPNDTLPNRPAVTASVRSKRETPTRRKGALPNPFEFLSAPHVITPFNCEDKVPGIAYADPQTECRMFHVCIPFSKGKLRDYQLYCEANKAMNQETGQCEPKEKVNCGRSLKFYVYNKWFRPQESRKDSWKSLLKKSALKKS